MLSIGSYGLFLCMQVLSDKLIKRSPLSLVAQLIKSLAAVWDIQVQSLCCEDPLQKEMATHSSILAWRIPWTEETASYSLWGRRAGQD